MVELVFSLFILSVLNFLTISHSANEVSVSCPINARLNLSGEVPDGSGLVNKSGYLFPKESRWHEDGVMLGCICYDKPCLPICCPLEMILVDGICVLDDNATPITFPSVHGIDLSAINGVVVNAQSFHMVVSFPCNINESYFLEPDLYPDDKFLLLKNGSIYSPEDADVHHRLRDIDEYCFWRTENSTTYAPIVCLENSGEVPKEILNVWMVIAVPFLLLTFIVYTILPELRNIHGFTIRAYFGSVMVTYTGFALLQNNFYMDSVYIIIVYYTSWFSFLASFFWLNVMCFDIWWTLGRSNLVHKSIKQSECKRCLIYSVYAWGFAILFTAIFSTMIHLPHCTDRKICLNHDLELLAILCGYGPCTVTVICNIIFFALTAVKLNRDEKAAARDLEGIDSKRHYDNKQWFNLYLKLFFIMGIDWPLQIILWFWKDLDYLQVIWNGWEILHGPLIFIILICKKSIIRQLIERFGCRVPNFLAPESTSQVHHGSKSTCSCF